MTPFTQFLLHSSVLHRCLSLPDLFLGNEHHLPARHHIQPCAHLTVVKEVGHQMAHHFSLLLCPWGLRTSSLAGAVWEWRPRASYWAICPVRCLHWVGIVLETKVWYSMQTVSCYRIQLTERVRDWAVRTMLFSSPRRCGAVASYATLGSKPVPQLLQ